MARADYCATCADQPRDEYVQVATRELPIEIGAPPFGPKYSANLPLTRGGPLDWQS